MKRRTAKRQVIVIGGGDSFLTYGAYRSFLKKRKIDIGRYRRPRHSWKGVLGSELGGRFEVIRVDMPNAFNAKYAEWKMWFEKFVPHLRREVVLVGHSLGGLFLAKYLSERRFKRKIRATFLVAPAWSEGDFRLPRNLKGFERQGGRIFLYQSEDDRVVPPGSHFVKYRKELPGAIVRMFARRGHFNQASFPELVRDIKGLYRQARG